MPIEESTPANLTVEEIRDVYSRLAPLYGLLKFCGEGKARHKALEMASLRKGEEVLEIAVGPGWALKEIVQKVGAANVVGMDLTADMLRRTVQLFEQEGAPLPPLCQGDGRLLPFADASFDCVFSSYMLDLLSLKDMDLALGEMRRVLRPSGRVILIHLAPGNLLFNWIWRALYWIIPNLLGGCRPIRVAPYLPQRRFRVSGVTRASQWGISAEIVVALRDG